MRYVLIFWLLFGIINSAPTYADMHKSNLPTNKTFSAQNYSGIWYEIARLPNLSEQRCRVPIINEYSFTESGLRVVHSCKWPSGKLDIAIGYGKFSGEPNVAKLKINFAPNILRFFNAGWIDYWILYTDYTRYAVVGSPDHKFLWIMARTENPPKEDIAKLVEFAGKLKFPTTKLIYNYPQYSPANK